MGNSFFQGLLSKVVSVLKQMSGMVLKVIFVPVPVVYQKKKSQSVSLSGLNVCYRIKTTATTNWLAY